MSNPSAPRGMDGRLAARLVVLVGALVGLFAMHGLGDHGAAPHEMHAAAMTPAVAAGDARHGEHSSHGDARDQSPAADSAAAPGSPNPALWMAGLCLAVLVGALIGFLLARPRLRTVGGLFGVHAYVTEVSGRGPSRRRIAATVKNRTAHGTPDRGRFTQFSGVWQAQQDLRELEAGAIRP